MINPRIYNIILDLKNKSYTSDIKVKQGDIDSNTFKIKLIQDSQAYNLTGLTTAAFFTRPDKAESFIDASITNAINGELEIKLTNQILNAEGYATCELKIIGTAGEVLSTLEFGFTILKSKDYTSVESSNEYNALVTALGKVGNLEAEYAPRLTGVESQLAETMNKTAVTLTHIFADNTARDTYFTSKPLEKINLTFIKVGTAYQQLINGVWTSANPILVEAVNQINDASTGLTKTLSASKELALLNLKANKTQEAWITPTFTNGATGTIRYRKNQFGKLEFTGNLTTISGAAAFALAVNYRPLQDIRFPVTATDGTSGTIIIVTGGSLYAAPSNKSLVVANTSISLEA